MAGRDGGRQPESGLKIDRTPAYPSLPSTMATLSDDTLRKVRSHLKYPFQPSKNDPIPKILVQIQQTAVHSQRSLNVSRQQTATKERERRILQLTIDEIGLIDKDVNMYKGVGKMWES